jgi:uncharacterized tellurite resistance protein B-like protein
MRLRRLLTSLGLESQPTEAADPFVRRLQAQLARLGADRLEYLAGFAGQLARVAHADAGISAAEGKAIAAQLCSHANLSDDEARVVVDILRNEFDVLRAVQPYILNRAINNHAQLAEKQTLVDCLYAVAAADHLVSDVEEQEIRRVADALMISHKNLMEIRGRYRDRIEVLQKLRALNTKTQKAQRTLS